ALRGARHAARIRGAPVRRGSRAARHGARRSRLAMGLLAVRDHALGLVALAARRLAARARPEPPAQADRASALRAFDPVRGRPGGGRHLRAMKIVEARLRRLGGALPAAISNAGASWSTREGLLLQLVTAEG